MKNARWLPIMALLASATMAGASESEPFARAYVDSSELHIGDRILYTIEVNHSKNASVDFSSVTDFGGLEAGGSSESEVRKAGDGILSTRKIFRLKSYAVGPYVIPAQSVMVLNPDGEDTTLKTNPVYVKILSLMGDSGEEAELRDIKPPMTLGRPWVFVAVLSALALAFLGGLFMWVRRRRKKSESPVIEKPLSAHEIAIRELDRIDRLGLLKQGKLKEHYYLVSECLRAYLEDRYDLHAPHKTTEEFIQDAVLSPKIRPEHINRLKEYLQKCDVVKFAEYIPPEREAEKLSLVTREFISETMETPNEPREVPA